MKKNKIQKLNKEENFLQATFEEQLQIILRTRGTRKIDFLISSPNGIRLTRQLSEEDVYLTIQEVGIEDALDLYEMSNYRQSQYIYDLEWWNRDQLDAAKIVKWLQYMIIGNGRKFTEWARNNDVSSLTAVFQKLIKVSKIDNLDNAKGDIPEYYFFTLDNMYYIDMIEPKNRPIITKAIKILRERIRTLYYEIMENVYWQVPFEMEETAFLARQNRLDEKGFPDMDEALSIYEPLFVKETDSIKLSDVSPIAIEINAKSPHYPISFRKKNLFFAKIFDDITENEIQERLLFELSHLSHVILIADFKEISYKTIQEVIRKSSGILNIGIEYLSQHNTVKAGNILRANFLKYVFRAGYSLIWRLKQRAEKLFYKIDEKEKTFWINFLDTPLNDVIESLLKPRPLFRAFQDDTQGLIEKEFETLSEIEQLENYIRQAELIIYIFKEKLSFRLDIPDILEGPFPQIMVREMNWSRLLNTMLVHFTIERKIVIAPIKIEMLELFHRKLFVLDSKESIITKDNNLKDTQQEDEKVFDRASLNNRNNFHSKFVKNTTSSISFDHLILLNDFHDEFLQKFDIKDIDIDLFRELIFDAFNLLAAALEKIPKGAAVLTKIRFFPELWFLNEF